MTGAGGLMSRLLQGVLAAVLVSAVSTASAFAQDSSETEPPIDAALAGPVTVWADGDVESRRFFGEALVGPRFEDKTELQVVFQQGDRYRVRSGDDFGWVSVSATTTTRPPLSLDLNSLSFDPALLGGPQLPPPNTTGAGGASK